MSAVLVPAVCTGRTVLVPIKIDVTYYGARYVDTLCWDIHERFLSVDEFSAQTCSDLNLPFGFAPKIALQISEQLDSFRQIIEFAHLAHGIIPDWENKIREHQIVTLGIRHHTIDYSDKILWDPMDSNCTPEEFAFITCTDLGLPMDIAPVIAYRIRETIFRWIIYLLEYPTEPLMPSQAEFKVAETKISLISANTAVDMVTNLWRRAKPSTFDEAAVVPQSLLPNDHNSNASIWIDDTS